MLVYYFVEIARPFGEAAAVLSNLLGGLSEAADISYREGEELRAEVGIAHPRVYKTVRLEVGDAISRPDQTTIPLHWEVIGGTGLFPAMDADLTLAKMGPRISQLSFRGSYEPPLHSLGAALDRILHRIAEATVKRFTDRLGTAVEAWPPEPPAKPGPMRIQTTPDRLPSSVPAVERRAPGREHPSSLAS
jgi:hypothetical protein